MCEWDGEIQEIIDKIPDGKYAIIVQDDQGTLLEGVTVAWNNETAVTPQNGVVYFQKDTVGQPIITATKTNYLPYSNEKTNYEKSEKGYDIITLYSEEEGKYRLSNATYKSTIGTTNDVLKGTKRLSLSNGSSKFSLYCTAPADDITKYMLLQGNKKIAETADGKFKDLSINYFQANQGVSVAVVNAVGTEIKTSINLQFVDDKAISATGFRLGGESRSFTVGENVPFIGGSKLTFAMPYVPLDIYVSDDTIHLGVNVDLPNDDHDACKKKIDKLKGLIDTMRYMQKTESKSGHRIGNTMQAEMNFLMKDKNQKAKWGPVDTSLRFIGYGEGKFDKSGKTTNVTVYFCLTGEVSKTLQGPTTMVVVVPVTYSVSLSAKGELIAELSYDLNTNTTNGDLSMTVTPGLKAFGGVGIGKIVGAGAYGSAKMPFGVQLWEPLFVPVSIM